MTDRIVITTIKAGKTVEREDTLVQQMTYTLELNGVHAITSVCCPGDLRSLAYGYLATQGYIVQGSEPFSVEQTGCNVTISFTKNPVVQELVPVASDYGVTPDIILRQVVESVKSGVIFRETGATHSASISREDSIECHVEDISRSAVLEKVIGCAFMKNIEIHNSFIILSSRVPSAFVRKIARVGIPIIAAISAPTVQAVNEADRLGICLCGFVRGNRMNVYANKWRLGL
ncbi:MAG: formate dehydrogenase accessory sulfurtransferase FdhD [Candidatus Aegiribacteria sp.]|nr:formate dehydrogenase accessory sulfurtransferase FdhD [Candidatus Aegiribacteria sp.]